MIAINTLTSAAVPLPRPNVDTDQIIPKQFLKRIERTGYGDFLFFDWRRLHDGPQAGQPDPAFILNDPAYSGAQILIAGKNFGCGSSREHAAWALTDYGFLAVIAPSFADIFFSNAGKNGMVLVRLPESDVELLTARSTANPAHRITIYARCPDRHRRARLQRPLRHRPIPQVLPAQRPRRHRPHPPPRRRPRRLRIHAQQRILAHPKAHQCLTPIHTDKHRSKTISI